MPLGKDEVPNTEELKLIGICDDEGIVDGVLDADSFNNMPIDINGKPEETLGKEDGKELNPEREELNHSGIKIGNADKDINGDNNEATGIDKEINNGVNALKEELKDE